MKIKDIQSLGLSIIFFIAFAVIFWYVAYVYSTGIEDTVSAGVGIIAGVAAIVLLNNAVET